MNDYAFGNVATTLPRHQHHEQGRDAQRRRRQARRAPPPPRPGDALMGRRRVVLVLKVEDHTQRGRDLQRAPQVIEPMVSTQWFVKMDGIAKGGPPLDRVARRRLQTAMRAAKELRESCAASSRFTPRTGPCKALASAAQPGRGGTKMGPRDAAPAD